MARRTSSSTSRPERSSGPTENQDVNALWFYVGKDTAMKETIYAGLLAALLAPATAAAQVQPQPGLGTEEFGMSPRELVQAIEKTEELIARCMREQGFQYIAVDYNTGRDGKAAETRLTGLRREALLK